MDNLAPINFIEIDKYGNTVIRITGNPKSIEERKNKMLAAEDMYGALKSAHWALNSGRVFIEKTGQYARETTKEMALEIIDKALAKAEGK